MTIPESNVPDIEAIKRRVEHYTFFPAAVPCFGLDEVETLLAALDAAERERDEAHRKNEAWQNVSNDCTDKLIKMKAKLDAAERENDRLREALERIIEANPGSTVTYYRRIAKAALEGEQ